MKTILIIEDDLDIQEILTYILEEQGYVVNCSVNGNEIDGVTDLHTDLILLDLRLGGSHRTGAEICFYLKKQQATQNLPVILVSAESNIAQIALTCGANTYIKKPFDIDRLTETVKLVLEQT